MSWFLDLLIAIAIITNGLLAGLFFVFTCAIIPGFRQIDDIAYVRAFRAINRAIINGWFLTVFFVAPLTAIAYAVLSIWYATGTSPLWAWAGAVSAALTFLITVAGNVPLNTRLDRVAANTEQECRTAREQFETHWNQRNLARTITSTGALVSLAFAGILT